MKKNTPLWGSISILIGVVIVILALTRGTLCTVLLIDQAKNLSINN